jgi:gamma-glutamyltranspeptidase
VVVDLWFIESKWRKRNVRLSREGAVGYKRYVLDAKGNVIPGKSTKSPLAIGVPGTIAGVLQSMQN